MSATLDPEPLRAFLPGACEIAAEGRLFPVRIEHDLRRDDAALEQRVRIAVEQALSETTGSVLVFLPGAGEIQRCEQALAHFAQRFDCLVLPLHGRLDPQAQDRALAPQARRKVVLATNVAESSLTIDGVTAVVDTGLHRALHSDPGSGVDVLSVERISLASAIQRTGRAGRTAPGVCYRLWTKGEERGMQERELPEIRRVDLCGPSLQVRAFAGRDPREFRWFEMPDQQALARADALLKELGAVDSVSGKVSVLGRELLRLPVHPRLGRVVLEGERRACAVGAATAAALLAEAPDLSRTMGEFADLTVAVDAVLGDEEAGARPGRSLQLPGGVLAAVQQARARLLDRRAGDDADPDALGRCLLAGFPDRVVARSSRGQREGTMVGGRGVMLPAACDGSDLVLALRLFETSLRQSRSQAVLVSPIEEAWLQELWPDAVGDFVRADLDETAGRVVAVRERRYRDLALRSARGGELPSGAAEALLAPLLTADPWRWLGEQRELRRLLDRAAWLRARLPELALPEWNQAELAQAALELLAGGGDLRALREGDLAGILLGRMLPQQRAALEREAPARLQLPSGRQAAVDYGAPGGPLVQARVQELFSVQRTPVLAGGRVPLVLEIQGPNQRPVQVTADLASFWRNVYPQLRREGMRRWPAHAWPEDPLRAAPQARPRRRR
jgi:ATP-dependent RNA helicase HrpB